MSVLLIHNYKNKNFYFGPIYLLLFMNFFINNVDFVSYMEEVDFIIECTNKSKITLGRGHVIHICSLIKIQRDNPKGGKIYHV